MGNGLYKIRVAVKSKGKEKSGGIRVITYFVSKVKNDENGEYKVVSLVTIYDKSEYDTISDKEQKFIVDKINEELDF